MKKAHMNVAVVGTGTWGAFHAQVFSRLPNVTLAAVCDLDGARASELANKHGIASLTDHRELLKMPDIDAVSIATPDFTHTPLVLDAIRAGKHVLCEKPLATSVAEAEQISKACAGSKRVFMIDFHNRVSPVIAAARDDIAAGLIGRAVHGAARLSNTTFVPLEMLSWSAKSSALWFLGAHSVDTLRFILNDEVMRVYATKGKGVLSSKNVDTDDFHLAMLTFSRGSVVTMENSWILSKDNPQIFDFSIRLVGSEGQLNLEPSHNGAYSSLTGGGLKYRDMLGVTPVAGNRIGGFVLESIARFADAVLDGTPVLAGVEDGLRVTKVLAAIEESAKSGTPVGIAY
jgi:predicted dehydrogenase